MRRASSKKRVPDTIYRSRQSGRTDIEELLAPNFDPHQRVTPSVVVAPTVGVSPTSQPMPFRSIDGVAQQFGPNAMGLSPSVVVIPTVGVTPTDSDLYTVGDSPSVGAQINNSSPITEKIQHMGAVDPTTTARTISVVRPTVGVSPSVRDLAPKEIAESWVSMSSGKVYDASRIKRINIAQHSMSMGENHLYQALWVMPRTEFFRLLSESKQVRRFSAGYDVLARVGRLNEKSIRDLLPKLKQKLILTEVAEADPAIRKGKTYDVFSYQQILNRQREAGLCFVVNNGRAVEFAVPYALESVGVTPTDTVGLPPTEVQTPTVVGSHTAPVGESPTLTVGVSPTPLDKDKQFRQNTTTPAELEAGMEKLIPGIDQYAIDRFWREGRAMVNDITAEELLHFFGERAHTVFRNRRLDNPLGVMLSSIPSWLPRDRVMGRRAQQRKDEEEMERILAEEAEHRISWIK